MGEESKPDHMKKLIVLGKERGFLTYDEINDALPSDFNKGEQIDGVYAVLDEIGIRVTDKEEEDTTQEESGKSGSSDSIDGDDDFDDDTELFEHKGLDSSIEDIDLGKTDDPVRMYLREMGSVDLLTREGEIVIAKRIEAGRNSILRAISDSAITFRMIKKLSEKILENTTVLREIIDIPTLQVEDIDDDVIDDDDIVEIESLDLDDKLKVTALNDKLKVTALKPKKRR